MKLSKVEDKHREGCQLIVAEVDVPEILEWLSLPLTRCSSSSPSVEGIGSPLYQVGLATDNDLVVRGHEHL